MEALEYYDSALVPPGEYFDWWYQIGRDWPVYDIIEMLSKINGAHAFLEKGSVADLGCEPGVSFPVLEPRFKFSQYLGVDGSRNMIDYINECHPFRSKIKTHCVNLESEKIPINDDSQVMTIACCVFGYLRDITHVLNESVRITCPDGYIAFNTWIHWQNRARSVVRDSSQNATNYAHALSLIDRVTEAHGLKLIQAVELPESDFSDPVYPFKEMWPLNHYTFLYRKNGI